MEGLLSINFLVKEPRQQLSDVMAEEDKSMRKTTIHGDSSLYILASDYLSIINKLQWFTGSNCHEANM